MDAKVLPPRPSLEQYRRQAKDLLRAGRAGDRDAVDRIGQSPRVRTHATSDGRRVEYALADAQFVLAREHGFESWPRFASHVESLAYRDAPVARFEAAADAVAAGDLATLDQLLAADPALVRARSTRAHHATLLHYVAANGVENFRQRTPPNAVAIARALLAAGADPRAAADTYGGGPHQTTLNLLVSSVHPARAGLQVALVDTLLDFGAPVDGTGADGSPLLTALAFHYPDAAAALARRGAAVRNVLSAAGLGHDDVVRTFFTPDGTLRAAVPLASVPWVRVANDPRAHGELALVWAAALGRSRVVEFLSRQRVDLGARDHQGFTALHWAAARGHDDVVATLLQRGAPLEAENVYGGTVLGAAVWASVHLGGVFRADGFTAVDYVPVVERLVGAGARVDVVRLPSGNPAVDEVLARHGARAT